MSLDVPLDASARRAIRGWAALDLVVTGALALPPLARLFVALVYSLNERFGGAATAPAFEPIHWLFVCLAGALGVLWATVRLLRPLAWLGLADAVARVWVAGLIVYFVVAEGAPLVLLGFAVTEQAGAIHQLMVVARSSPGAEPA